MEYIGQKEDEQWFRQISMEQDSKQSDEEMYRLLVQKMNYLHQRMRE